VGMKPEQKKSCLSLEDTSQKKKFNNVNHINLEVATYLDIILYSRDQIIEENKAMGVEHTNGEYEWGIISIKPQMCGSEIKMDPITMMRNALGKDEGGSGVKLNREEYKMSADFWNKNAIIK